MAQSHTKTLPLCGPMGDISLPSDICTSCNMSHTNLLVVNLHSASHNAERQPFGLPAHTRSHKHTNNNIQPQIEGKNIIYKRTQPTRRHRDRDTHSRHITSHGRARFCGCNIKIIVGWQKTIFSIQFQNDQQPYVVAVLAGKKKRTFKEYIMKLRQFAFCQHMCERRR